MTIGPLAARHRLRLWLTHVKLGLATPEELEAITSLLWLLRIEVGDETLEHLMSGTILDRDPRSKTDGARGVQAPQEPV